MRCLWLCAHRAHPPAHTQEAWLIEKSKVHLKSKVQGVRGGICEVWKGRWRHLPVAVKRAPRNLGSEAWRRRQQSLLSEVEFLRAVRHPHIVR